MTLVSIDTLVLAGGGLKGFAELGALHYLVSETPFKISKIESFVATSVGSAISLLLICGYEPIEIFYEVYKTVEIFEDVKKTNLFNSWGFISIETLGNKLKSMIFKKLVDPNSPIHLKGVKEEELTSSNIPTLEELRSLTLKNLTVVVANISKMKGEYMSASSHPNVPCIDAVMMSCGLPIIFQSIHMNGSYYIDGGFYDNFPMKYACDGKENPQTVLGIVTKTDYADKIESFFEYIDRIVSFQFIIATEQNITAHTPTTDVEISKGNVLEIELNGQPIFQLKMESSKKGKLFSNGYDAAKAYGERFDSIVRLKN